MKVACFTAGFAVATRLVSAQPAVNSLADLKLARTIELKANTDHVQGMDLDSHYIWVTSVDVANRKGYLLEFVFPSGELVRRMEVQDGARFHPGGIASDEGSLWVPVAEYRPNSSSVIQRRNKRTLQIESAFGVPDHIGCIAVTPRYLIGGNWDSREFYVWDFGGKLIRKVSNANHNAYQDMKADGEFIVASGVLPDRSGAIDWLKLPSLQISRRVKAGNTDRQVLFTREGMAVRAGQLLLLPEDSPSRVFVFPLEY